MSGQQSNAWQTARPRQSQSASRSGTGSPQSQPPRQDRSGAAQNVWIQRTSQSGERPPSTGSERQQSPASTNAVDHTPANGFNSAEVKAFLSRGAQGAPAAYKPAESGNGRGGGGAWAVKANHTANGQPFFATLARQVAGLENGG